MSKWRCKSRSNLGLTTKGSQRGPRPRKDTKKYPEKLENKPGPQTIWDKSPLGITMVLSFGNLFLKLLSRHEAWCDSKPACKGNLRCQSYLCFAFQRLITMTSPPSCQTSLKARRHTGSTTVRAHANETFSYSLREGSLKPCRVH